MDLVRRIVDGLFAAALAMLGLTMADNFVKIINAGTTDVAKLFGTVSGQTMNPFYKNPS